MGNKDLSFIEFFSAYTEWATSSIYSEEQDATIDTFYRKFTEEGGICSSYDILVENDKK